MHLQQQTSLCAAQIKLGKFPLEWHREDPAYIRASTNPAQSRRRTPEDASEMVNQPMSCSLQPFCIAPGLGENHHRPVQLTNPGRKLAKQTTNPPIASIARVRKLDEFREGSDDCYYQLNRLGQAYLAKSISRRKRHMCNKIALWFLSERLTCLWNRINSSGLSWVKVRAQKRYYFSSGSLKHQLLTRYLVTEDKRSNLAEFSFTEV